LYKKNKRNGTEELDKRAGQRYAQGDEANLAQEEYFREILRGYGPKLGGDCAS